MRVGTIGFECVQNRRLRSSVPTRRPARSAASRSNPVRGIDYRSGLERGLFHIVDGLGWYSQAIAHPDRWERVSSIARYKVIAEMRKIRAASGTL
jgi:hypothetical protein